MTTRTEALGSWRAQMRDVATLLARSKEPLPLRALGSAFPGLTDRQQRTRIGQFVLRDWLATQRRRGIGNRFQFYRLGPATDWQDDTEPLRPRRASAQPLERAVRFVAYGLEVAREAPSIGDEQERRHAALARDGAHELAVDELVAALHQDPRLAHLRQLGEQLRSVTA